MEERVWRVMEAMPPMARQSRGMMVWRRLIAKSSWGQTKPLEGSQPSFMAKMYMNRMPSQNCGRQQQTLAVRVTAVSAAVPRLTALMMPKMMPSGTLITKASRDR